MKGNGHGIISFGQFMKGHGHVMMSFSKSIKGHGVKMLIKVWRVMVKMYEGSYDQGMKV